MRVLRVVEETDGITTLVFKDQICASARPGQFIMVYVPDLEEVPMSLSAIGPGALASITVKAVGETTRALSNLKPGSLIGIRGPFGRGFSIEGRRPLVVGGGVGLAPLMPLLEALVASGLRPKLIMGARTGSELPFLSRARGLLGPGQVRVATEDGSLGSRGLATDLAAEELAGGQYDVLYACGPEAMLARLLEIALEASLRHVQMSLERLVKCGMGLCGHCSLGPFLVCRDGPVFDLAMLTNPEVRAELGRLWRNEAGLPVGLDSRRLEG